MNIEALTKDLDAVFQKHGISGPLQRCMQIAFCSGLSPYQEHLFTQLLAGGSLFVIGDSGAISAGGLRPSKNAKMLKDVLNAVTPEQFGRFMQRAIDAGFEADHPEEALAMTVADIQAAKNVKASSK